MRALCSCAPKCKDQSTLVVLATARVMIPCQISHTRRYFDFNQIETIVEPRKLITKLLEPKPNSDDAVNNAKNRSQNVALIYHIRKIFLFC